MTGIAAAGPRRIKKFYKAVTVASKEGAHTIFLDGRAAKTPVGAALAAPSRALGEAIAAEWNGDGDFVDFNAMALTRLASTAIDLGSRDRGRWADEIIDYLKFDLVCRRAEEPAALVARQEAAWSEYAAWAKTAFGADLRMATGLAAPGQPDAALAGARARIEAMDDWALIGARTAAGITSSAVIGVALAARAFPAAEMFAASRLDERFQAERWGVDAEAAAREARLEAEFLALARWFELIAAIP